jgi:hypothetical protein
MRNLASYHHVRTFWPWRVWMDMWACQTSIAWIAKGQLWTWRTAPNHSLPPRWEAMRVLPTEIRVTIYKLTLCRNSIRPRLCGRLDTIPRYHTVHGCIDMLHYSHQLLNPIYSYPEVAVEAASVFLPAKRFRDKYPRSSKLYTLSYIDIPRQFSIFLPWWWGWYDQRYIHFLRQGT